VFKSRPSNGFREVLFKEVNAISGSLKNNSVELPFLREKTSVEPNLYIILGCSTKIRPGMPEV